MDCGCGHGRLARLARAGVLLPRDRRTLSSSLRVRSSQAPDGSMGLKRTQCGIASSVASAFPPCPAQGRRCILCCSSSRPARRIVGTVVVRGADGGGSLLDAEPPAGAAVAFCGAPASESGRLAGNSVGTVRLDSRRLPRKCDPAAGARPRFSRRASVVALPHKAPPPGSSPVGAWDSQEMACFGRRSRRPSRPACAHCHG